MGSTRKCNTLKKGFGVTHTHSFVNRFTAGKGPRPKTLSASLDEHIPGKQTSRLSLQLILNDWNGVSAIDQEKILHYKTPREVFHQCVVLPH